MLFPQMIECSYLVIRHVSVGHLACFQFFIFTNNVVTTILVYWNCFHHINGALDLGVRTVGFLLCVAKMLSRKIVFMSYFSCFFLKKILKTSVLV